MPLRLSRTQAKSYGLKLPKAAPRRTTRRADGYASQQGVDAAYCLTLVLPWPPSVNHYWRSIASGAGVHVLLSRQGHLYRDTVRVLCLRDVPRTWRWPHPPLTIDVVAHPPDKRERDLDNLGKALMDALMYGGVLCTDSQHGIRRLTLEWGRVIKGGEMKVTIQPYEEETYDAHV